MIGKTISHYKILEKLGEGGMGVVYRARDTKLDRDVALKFLPPNLAVSQEEIKRFETEGKAVSSLNHPNIATIFDIDEVDDPTTVGKQRYLVLEYIPGGTLKTKLKQLKSEDKRFSVADVINYGIQIAEALAHAHLHHIVHRDVKTDNIMLTAERKVKLTDFGLAKLRGRVQVTKTGSTLGTAAYMSPEQIRGEEADQRSDIFSFGVVLYELVTSQLPFQGEFEAALSYSILNEHPQPVKSLRADVPEALERIINRCLEKDPAKRYQSADEITKELSNLEQSIGSKSSSMQDKFEENRLIRRRGVRLALGSIAFVVIIGVVSVILFYPESGSNEVNRKSIAVLPFKNLSDSKEDEYFSDGLTEDLIAQLSKISDLRVISRTSVMQFKGINKSIREIAAELNVVNILEGSVRSAGNNVRIVAQLIDATKDDHLWAETYDREMTQIFTIQSDIAFRIATALRSTLTQGERDRIQKKPTENITSYSYYMRGREYYNLYTNEYNEKAVSLFQKSLQLDPQYALAYAGLGDAFAQRVLRFGYPAVWIDSSITYSTKAIALDPTLAEGYKALGLSYASKGWFRRAIEMYNKAIEYNPGATSAIINIGIVKLNTGKFDEAVEWLHKGLQSDPLAVNSYVGLGYAYFSVGDIIKHEETVNKWTILDPNNVHVYIGNSMTAMLQKEYKRAMDEIMKPLSAMPDNVILLSGAGDIQLAMGNLTEAKKYYESVVKKDSLLRSTVTGRLPLLGLGYIMWKGGNHDGARKVFTKIVTNDQKEIGEGNERFSLPLAIACINAIEGKKDEAYKWLQKAVDAGWRYYNWAQVDPMLENLWGDEKFKTIMTFLKNDIDRMRERMMVAEKQ